MYNMLPTTIILNIGNTNICYTISANTKQYKEMIYIIQYYHKDMPKTPRPH